MHFTLLSPQQQTELERAIAQQHGRVLALELAGEAVIVKRQEGRNRPLAYSLLNLLARSLRQPLLCAVPAPGGAAGQAIEARRLQTLHAAGVLVPELLAAQPGYLVMRNVGKTSIDHLLAHQPADQRKVWLAGLNAILATHRCGQALSQAFARNIIFHAGQVHFIDFEDDPLSVLSLAEAQSRDWLFYLHSTSYLLRAGPAEQAQLLARYLRQDDPIVQQLVTRSANTLAWLRYLPKQRKPWGRDVISLQGAAATLHAYRCLDVPGPLAP
ncbi:hypothetical protein [Chitinibacter sp. ZOR0017]|uniref:hypothetical protein n=1 Tax=Chitinibacter sp. ZOR0017 TaxID=1339254 RepID=UPI000645A83A|nr:hypothetical protein [Chitinibacter sp. ZOR0017]